jgi:hypothetical protein
MTDKPTLETRWLMTLRGKIAPPTAVSPSLLVFNVNEASIDSPRLKAQMVQPSGDWVRVQADGSWRLDVRLLMKTDDGEFIYSYYSGIVCMTPEVSEHLAKGGTIGDKDIYFRSAPYFETSSPKYAWLNHVLAIGKITSFGNGDVVYDVFEVL